MLKSIFTAASLLLSLSAFAQFSISGFIRSGTDNHVLTGATVQIEASNRVAVSDEFGYFRIEKLSSGKYSILIRILGYADKIETVALSGNVELNILLEEKTTITDEVVVTATRATDKMPATFTNMSKQTIQKQNFGQDLPYLLNWTPSVVTTSDAGTGVGYTGIRIRGSDPTRINVTINGIPYNDSESLGTFWVDVPDIASSSQSIQVQRGVGTSTNGGGAFGGTINLQTNTRNDDAYGEVVNSFGSFDTRRHTLAFGTGLIKKHWVIDGRASRIASDGFIDRASSNLQSYYFSGGYYGKNTMLKAILFGGKERTYQSWYGVPESRLKNDVEAMLTTAANEQWNAEQTANLLNSSSRTFNPYTYKNQVDDYNQGNYQLHFVQRLNQAITFNTSLHYTNGLGYYEEYKYDDDIQNYGLPNPIMDDDGIAEDNDTISNTDIIRRRWLNNDFYGLTYSLNYERENKGIILGGGWNRYVCDHFGEIIWSKVAMAPFEYRYYFNDSDKKDYNIFLKMNYSFTTKLNGFIDLQYRGVSYRTTGIENKQEPVAVNAAYDFFNPKAGLTYSVKDYQLIYASYSVANREPVRNDFVDAVAGKTPLHETLHDIEVGYKKTTDRYMINIDFFNMNYKNQLVLTGELNDVGASLRKNVDKSYRMGIEIEGRVKIDKFVWSANFTFSRNKIKKFTEVLYDYGANFDEYTLVEKNYSDTDISFSPNVIAGSGLSYLPFKGAEVTLLSKYVDKQYLDNTSNVERSISAYLVNDLRLSYTWRPVFAKELVFSLLINNLLNEKYSSNGYTWGYIAGDTYRENYYYPQAGRNFMAMVALRF